MEAKTFLPRIALVAFLISSPLHAQYVVRQWNIEHGLPQSSIRCITQTHDGYLWIGTWNGLARFDGVHMTIFNALNRPDFHPSVSAIYEDRQHRLWIGTDGGGLFQYRDGALVRLDSADGIAATMINSIDEDRQGRVWFGTDNGVFVHTGDRFLHFGTRNGFPELATHVVPAPDGSMYLQFVGPVFHVRISNDSLIVLGKPFQSGGYRIAIDSSGTLWYGVKGKGLVRRVGSEEYLDRRFAKVQLKETFVLPNRQKWMMTPHGPYVLDGNKVEHFQMIDGIDFSNIATVFEDREGILWVGVEGAGLLRLRQKQVQTFTKRDGLETDAIMCGMEDRSGNVWIGTWLGGLGRRDAERGERFTSVPALVNGMSIMALEQSSDGTMWVGTWGHGVHTIEHGKVRRFVGKGLDESTTIRTIVSDPRGGVWIATVYGIVGYYNGAEQKTWDSRDGIPGHINSMLLTRSGEIWVGTDGGGVVVLSGGNVTVMNRTQGLLDDFSHVSLEDSDGGIWLTSKRGLQRWKNGTLSTIDPTLGLDDDPAQFIQDDQGDYWIGGTHGIHRIRHKDLNDAADGKLRSLSYLTIGKADGMPVEECAGGSNELVWKTRDGALWFSTTHGAVRIDPRSVASNPVPPGVMIDQVLVEHSPVQWNQQVVLSPQETKIEFHYTGINFAAPERIRFQSKLEGFEDDWRDVGYERFAQFTNLAPGKYIFRVKAVNNAGVWNDAGASIDVLVQPPFWETWWFRGVAIVVFLSVGPLIYWRRVSGLKKEKERQQEFSRRLIAEQERERQRIANELHDSLGQNLLVLKNRILVAQQEKKNGDGLGEMSDLVSQTIEEVRSISHNLRPHQLDQLGVSKTIRALLKNVAESSSITFTVEVEDIDALLKGDEDIGLFRIIQESLNNIIKHSKANQAGVFIKKDSEGVIAMISDNGNGMDVRAEQAKEELGRGFGLSGMKERAKMFGWNLEIRSQPNKGTAVRLAIPLTRK